MLPGAKLDNRRAWQWALIVAVVLLPALVVSLVGAYAGVFLRFIARLLSKWLEHYNDPGSTAAS